MGYWDYYPRYSPSRPKEVKNGLRTRKKRGEIGETWWARRFLEVLDGFGWSNRLVRGRGYARSGQVVDYQIDHGIIRSKVQGTQRRPYTIEIRVKTLSNREWAKVIKTMAQQARFSAKLLTGEMPQNIEEAFKEVKIPLFPSSQKDFSADCSCPDWANPCKHIAAACYIIGEAFDRDPFLIFHLRGLDKEGLLKALHQEMGVDKTESSREIAEEKEEIVEPLSDLPMVFWKMSGKIDYHFSLKSPPLNAAILRRLGVPQFWRGTAREFYEDMEKVYSQISKSASKIAYISIEPERSVQ